MIGCSFHRSTEHGVVIVLSAMLVLASSIFVILYKDGAPGYRERDFIRFLFCIIIFFMVFFFVFFRGYGLYIKVLVGFLVSILFWLVTPSYEYVLEKPNTVVFVPWSFGKNVDTYNMEAMSSAGLVFDLRFRPLYLDRHLSSSFEALVNYEKVMLGFDGGHEVFDRWFEIKDSDYGISPKSRDLLRNKVLDKTNHPRYDRLFLWKMGEGSWGEIKMLIESVTDEFIELRIEIEVNSKRPPAVVCRIERNAFLEKWDKWNGKKSFVVACV